jgi:zinc transport system substrate-binding protein
MTRTLAFILLTGLTLAGCAGSTPGTDGRLQAFVSILPEAFFVERIGGDHVSVEVLVGPGQSPHSYEPTPRQLTRLAGARVFFAIGVPFEKALLARIKRSFPGVEVVDTRAGIELREAEEHDGHDDDAGGPDPHVWLNPRNARLIAASIRDALVRLDPAHAADYRANFDALAAQLDALDARLAKALAPLAGRRFYVFHPAFGYFGQAYGLTQVAVETGGREPSPRELAALIESAKADGVRVIFVQPQFSKSSAEAVARAIGGVVAPVDPLAKDYIANLERLAAALSDALGAPGKE